MRACTINARTPAHQMHEFARARRAIWRSTIAPACPCPAFNGSGEMYGRCGQTSTHGRRALSVSSNVVFMHSKKKIRRTRKDRDTMLVCVCVCACDSGNNQASLCVRMLEHTLERAWKSPIASFRLHSVRSSTHPCTHKYKFLNMQNKLNEAGSRPHE